MIRNLVPYKYRFLIALFNRRIKAYGLRNFFFHPIQTYMRVRRFGIRTALARINSVLKPVLSTSEEETKSTSVIYNLENPLRVRVNGSVNRVNLFLDSLRPDSFFGGVGTAVLFSYYLAMEINYDLRIVTREARSSVGSLNSFFESLGIERELGIEYVHVDSSSRDLVESSQQDVFVAASWWRAEELQYLVPKGRLVHLIQEDERLFYPAGDYFIRAQNILESDQIIKVINTEGLRSHFINSGLMNISTNSVSFEPTFPIQALPAKPQNVNRKLVLLFYARPNHPRNLYETGIALIDGSIKRGIIDPELFEIHLVGTNLGEVSFSSKIETKYFYDMPWKEYLSVIEKADIGIAYMATPHPGYPVFDLANHGAYVITNRFPGKMELSQAILNVDTINLSQTEFDSAIKKAQVLIKHKGKESSLENSYKQTWKNALSQAIVVTKERLKIV
jgi:hypothetical protein